MSMTTQGAVKVNNLIKRAAQSPQRPAAPVNAKVEDEGARTSQRPKTSKSKQTVVQTFI